jgi:iron complex outermembrane receptor protein
VRYGRCAKAATIDLGEKVKNFYPAVVIATSLFCMAGRAAVAQQDASAQPTKTAATTPPETPQKIKVVDEVTVSAEGETRDVQTIDSKLLLEETPGTSPIAALAHLPSVSVTTADPYGAYEWALRISVRGFNQNQLGFTLDDVPLGDMSYGNLNGLHISRALIDENLGKASISQGTGALDTASTSNLGGAIQFFSNDPSDKRTFQATQSFGSFSGSRTFARFDSGMLPGRFKLFVDGVYQTSDKWRGAGPIRQSYFQFNAKIEKNVGSSGMLTFYADYSNRQEVDYQDDNKVWVQKLGYNWDNFGDWGESIQAAYACDGLAPYPTQISALSSSEDQCDAGYYAAGGLRKDFLGYVKYATALTSHVSWKTTLYGHHNDGTGLWFTPYVPTYDASLTFVSPISERTSEYRIARGGVVSALTHEIGHNTIEGGLWFEKESFDLARRYYSTTTLSPTRSIYDVPEFPFYTQWAYNFPTNLFQIHLQDQFKLNSKLTLQGGFKTSETYTTGNLVAFNAGLDLHKLFYGVEDSAANYAQGKLTSGKPFLPQGGVNYKFTSRDEVFGDAALNTRSFQAGGNGFGTSPWGTTQAGFDALTKNLKAESSVSEEAGFRHNSNFIQAQASFFHTNFHNRLLAITQGAGIIGNPAILSNVGGVTTNGVDGAISARIHAGWTFYNAVTYNKSTYDSNYGSTSSTGVVTTYDTGGKITVDSPQFLYKNELSYGMKGFDLHLGSDYMGKRYFTYSNDNSVGGRFLGEFGTSFHKDEVGPFDELKLQLNVYNIASTKYWATVGTNGFVVNDPTSVGNNTLQTGTPRTITGSFTVKF